MGIVKRGKWGSPKRTEQAPGTMQRHPGHRSRSGKKKLTPKRWIKEKKRLLQQAPEGMSPAEADQWADKKTGERFRMGTRRGR